METIASGTRTHIKHTYTGSLSSTLPKSRVKRRDTSKREPLKLTTNTLVVSIVCQTHRSTSRLRERITYIHCSTTSRSHLQSSNRNALICDVHGNTKGPMPFSSPSRVDPCLPIHVGSTGSWAPLALPTSPHLIPQLVPLSHQQPGSAAAEL